MKSQTLQKNKDEIIYNIINSCLAGALVFVGSCIDGEFTIRGVLVALLAGIVVLLTKFKEYWDGEKSEYTRKAFNFI